MIHPMIEKVAEKLRRHRLNLFEHQATATIRSALEYARDNVSDGMIKRGMEHADGNGMLCELPDDFVGVFRAMTDALIQEIEE